MHKIFLSIFLILLGGLLATNRTQAARTRLNGPTLTIAVKNYARVDAATLDNAEEKATLIFRKAGVRVKWIDLTFLSSGGLLTNGSPSVFLLQVHIIGMSDRLGYPDHVMGIAPGSGEDRQLVYVFYDRVEAFVERQKIARMEGRELRYPNKAQILGELITHELGHVLLNQRSHSTTGIMRENWNLRDLEDGRGLLFTGPQPEIIRMEVAKRFRQQGTARAIKEPLESAFGFTP